MSASCTVAAVDASAPRSAMGVATFLPPKATARRPSRYTQLAPARSCPAVAPIGFTFPKAGAGKIVQSRTGMIAGAQEQAFRNSATDNTLPPTCAQRAKLDAVDYDGDRLEWH